MLQWQVKGSGEKAISWDLPLWIGFTPDAKQRPPKRLLNIWLCSSVAVALLVISMPAARPSYIWFRLRLGWLCVGWLWVDIRTPACAFRKISFSSSNPGKNEGKLIMWIQNIYRDWYKWDKKIIISSLIYQVYYCDAFNSPLPPLNIQIPASLPSYILFRRRMGLLSVFIHTPAMALSNISFCSSNPSPPLYTNTPPFWPPQILLRRMIGLLPVLKRSSTLLLS